VEKTGLDNKQVRAAIKSLLEKELIQHFYGIPGNGKPAMGSGYWCTRNGLRVSEGGK